MLSDKFKQAHSLRQIRKRDVYKRQGMRYLVIRRGVSHFKEGISVYG